MSAPYRAKGPASTASLSDKAVARLKIASAVMGVLIILALAGVGYGFYQNFARLNAGSQTGPEAVAPVIAELALPAGLFVRDVKTGEGGSLWVWLSARTMDQLFSQNRQPDQLWLIAPDGGVRVRLTLLD